MSWNNFPKHVTNNIIKKVINKTTSDDESNQPDQRSVINIWFHLRYCGDKSVQLANSWIKKIKRYCQKDFSIKIKLLHDTTKLVFFCSNKDKTPLFNKSYVVYHFNYPGCCASYVGKTETTLHERCIEHAWKDKSSAIRTHIDECEGIIRMKNLMFMNTSLNGDITTPDHREKKINIVNKIKELKPLLNNGFKASKELDLF